MKRYFIVGLMALMQVSCEHIIPGRETSVETHEKRNLVLSAKEVDMSRSQNDFSLRLLRQVVGADTSNCMISPLSVDMVLSMLACGSAGETQDEIRTALGTISWSQAESNAYREKLIMALPYLDTQTQFKLANALWLDAGFVPTAIFTEVVRSQYHATLDNLELSDPSSASVINDWADENTNHLIKEVVSPSDFNDDLRMVIANALYFKGYWEEQFEKECTFSEPFYLGDGSTEATDMMHQTARFAVTREDKKSQARLLRMPYRGQGYAMDVILPREGQSMADFLATFTADSLAALEQGLSYAETVVKLPKFKSRYARMLNDDMQRMGIKRLFSADAQLGGLSQQEKLFLSALKQVTYISVDEEGTEAAAVTVGMVGTTSVEPSVPVCFYATRPFVYLIRDVKYGIILFAGVYVQP